VYEELLSTNDNDYTAKEVGCERMNKWFEKNETPIRLAGPIKEDTQDMPI